MWKATAFKCLLTPTPKYTIKKVGKKLPRMQIKCMDCCFLSKNLPASRVTTLHYFPISTTQNQPVKYQQLTCSQLSHLLKHHCRLRVKEDNDEEKMQLLAKLCIYLRQISSVNWSCLLKPIKHNFWPRVESRAPAWCYCNDSPVTGPSSPARSPVDPRGQHVAHRGRCFVCFVEWLITYFSMEQEIS